MKHQDVPRNSCRSAATSVQEGNHVLKLHGRKTGTFQHGRCPTSYMFPNELMIIPAYSSKIECVCFQFKKFVNQVNGSSCDRISLFADDLLQIFAIFNKFQSKCWTHLNAIYFCLVSSMSRPQVLLVPSFDRLRWVQRCSGKFLSTESTVRLLMDH